jgi:hypothetical protein
VNPQIIASVSCCAPGSIRFELIKGLPAAFVTLIIGGIAAGITWRQYQVAKAKLQFDLFEKRYAIFHQVWVIFSEVVFDGTRKKNYAFYTPFNNLLPEAAFLFGKNIEMYLTEAAKKWTELKAAETEIEGQGTTSQQSIDKQRELTNWFEEQGSRGIKQIFGCYLNFEEWK